MNAVIAIDGPAASGKSTVSRRLAESLGYLYVDSGALYRAVAWITLERGIDPQSVDQVAVLTESLSMEFFVEGSAVGFRLNGHVPGAALRTERVNQAVSPVAANPVVRHYVTSRLREMRSLGSLIMEGRDIGTVVFPEATYKFYLDANPAVRAQRRHAEMTETASVDAVGASLNRRDRIDSARKTAPLAVAADAIVVDSSSMGIDDVVAFARHTIDGGK